jgi:hypothetical protein
MVRSLEVVRRDVKRVFSFEIPFHEQLLKCAAGIWAPSMMGRRRRLGLGCGEERLDSAKSVHLSSFVCGIVFVFTLPIFFACSRQQSPKNFAHAFPLIAMIALTRRA